MCARILTLILYSGVITTCHEILLIFKKMGNKILKIKILLFFTPLLDFDLSYLSQGKIVPTRYES